MTGIRNESVHGLQSPASALAERHSMVDPLSGTPVVYEYVDENPSVVHRVIEKKVGRREIVEDVIVEVPELTYQDRIVTVPVTREHAVPKTVKRVQPRTVQEIRRVPKIVEREVKKIVHVKGEPREVVVLQEVITHRPVEKFYDKRRPVIVAQSMHPSVKVNEKVVEVPVARLTPKIQFVDVHVALPIKRSSDFKVIRDEHFQRPAKVPDAQFNSLLVAMNNHLSEDQLKDLPFKRALNGEVNVSPERLNAVLLNDNEAQAFGISIKEPKEIFPRGHSVAHHIRPSTHSITESGARLVSDVSLTHSRSGASVSSQSHSLIHQPGKAPTTRFPYR